MQRKSLARRNRLREGNIARDQLGRGDQVESGRGQHRDVQRLADMAWSFWAARVLVQEAAAASEIQQQGTSKYCQCAAHEDAFENGSPSEHQTTRYLNTFDGGRGDLVAAINES